MLSGFLLGETEGVLVGSLDVEIYLEEPILLSGAGYKILKSLVAAGCPGQQAWRGEEARFVSISPPMDSRGRLLLYREPGWRKKLETMPQTRVSGPLRFTISWAGAGRRHAESIIACMSRAVPLRVLSASIEVLQEEPASAGTIRLVTPAQFKFSARTVGGVVLPFPSAWRFIRHGVDLVLGREDHEVYMLLARFLEITEGTLRRVTVYIDRDRPTSWALTGWVRIEANRRAPEKVLNMLGWGLRLAGYLGVGKSRLEGLGRAEVENIL